jgi:hypothetical protein
MNILKKNKLSFEDIFIIISSFIISIFLISIFLTIFNLFYFVKYIVLILISFFFITSIYLITLNKIKFNISRKDIYAVVVVAVFCAFSVLLFHEGFTGGRDDGVYANSALYLSKFNTFYIHEQNVSSYPGFIVTSKGIITQFYLGYPSWLAMLFSLFGPNILNYVNFPLLAIGLMSIYYICKKLVNWKIGILSVVLISTSYPFLWFTRSTFSENLSFMLTWFGILCLLKSFENHNKKYILLSLISINILLTVRVESIPLVILLNCFLIWGYFKYKMKSSLFLLLTILGICLIPVIYYYTYLDPRYIGIFSSKLSSILSMFTGNHQSTALSDTIVNTDRNIIEYQQPYFVFYLLQHYNIYFFILMIPLALIKTFFNKNKIIASSFLVIILLLSVNFFFLVKPSINFDQPWFLRRYMPVILPLGIMCFCIVISSLNKKAQMLIISIIISFNIFIASPILTLKQNYNVLAEANDNLVPLMSPKDLLLVDYDSTGRYKLAEPLFFRYNINTVAANADTVNAMLGFKSNATVGLYDSTSFKIPSQYVCSFDNIYILTSSYEPNLFTRLIDKNKITDIKNLHYEYPVLLNTCELFRITKKATPEQMANVNIREAKAFCSQIPNEINAQSIDLKLKKLDSSIVQQIKSESCSNKKI